jgi:peptidoglycan/LPS O-acetylase OafA/YrhL
MGKIDPILAAPAPPGSAVVVDEGIAIHRERPPAETGGSARHFGLDWLRVTAFALLILYHSGMVFAPGDWLIKAPHPVAAASWLMIAVQPWRLPLLFVVSGFASGQLLKRSNGVGAFLAARSFRLLLPVGFGLLFVVPPEVWVSLVSQHSYPHGFLYFWSHDWFRFRSTDGLALPNLSHLWFLTYLWTYTLVLGVALAFLPAWLKTRIARGEAEALSRSRLLWLPLALLLPLRLALLFTVPETGGWFHDWVSDVTFLPAFLFGFALAKDIGLWQAVRGATRGALLLAAAAFATLLAIELTYPGFHPHAVQVASRAAQLVLAWSAILLLLRLADRLRDFDHPWRRTLTEAVFPLYIAHQTVIVLTAWWLLPYRLNYGLLASAIIAAAFGGSWLFYLAARHAGPLRPCLGLSPPRRNRRDGPADLLAAMPAEAVAVSSLP